MIAAVAGDETIDDLTASARARDRRPAPGIVFVFAGGAPSARVLPLADGAVELGRGAGLDDERASRRHARVTCERGRWRVADLGSRNGTFLDGEAVREAGADAAAGGLVRIGRTLLLLVDDVRAYTSGVRAQGERVVGPTLRRAWDEIARAAAAGETLLVTGETGTGKELAARHFHESGPNARGAFVAVNCAAIPEGVAERLLFGAKKGAFSGATADAEGYFRAADRGTLFLDELAELDPAVQGKLLRVLETREVMPLGAAQGTRVDVRVVAATTADVRAAVAAGKFRRDLYFRVGKPEVHLPALRERREEIPWLVAHLLRDIGDGMTADALFVEACALRAWPGNVRELLGAVRRAAHAARAERRLVVEARDLEESAGVAFGGAAPQGEGGDEAPRREPARAEVEAALREARGNVTGAAKRLGLHRNQLRRWLAKNPDVDPTAYE
jgi:transcriptional regulator with PAS, ATPase and Fis domain